MISLGMLVSSLAMTAHSADVGKIKPGDLRQTAAELTGNKAIAQFAGYEGIFCGLSAIYAAMAQVWNETFGREVLPLGA